ncbi:TIGR02611 family protein [Corynebacterium hylobatis]|uniref:TIGR02611 family protein n=1 Tax=Corynebacterium hylobatis TaxID=1859290 RepID=A0A430HZP2_9CORY|nr:TIGR02611 family protein [Corynebacterium hylobatis]RSZ64266.1 TIGR02611 family protein [Corynebacterium hylobatis]
MASMRQMVSYRVDRLAHTHTNAKDGRYGYLVRPLTLILGWSVLIIGLITIPLPGQGWLTTFIGVGILSLEQEWARSLLGYGVRLYDRFHFWFNRQPQLFRILATTALIVLIWVVFFGVTWGAWRMGNLDFLTPYAHRIGLVR